MESPENHNISREAKGANESFEQTHRQNDTNYSDLLLTEAGRTNSNRTLLDDQDLSKVPTSVSYENLHKQPCEVNQYDFEPAVLKPEFDTCRKKSIDKTIEYWLTQGISCATVPIYTGLGLDLITRNKKMTCTRFVVSIYSKSIVKGAQIVTPKIKDLAKKVRKK